MRKNGWPVILAGCVLCGVLAARAADTLSLSADRESAVYDRGEMIVFAVDVSSNGVPIPGRTATYTFEADGQPTVIGTNLDPKAGHGTCNPAVLPRLKELIGKE